MSRKCDLRSTCEQIFKETTTRRQSFVTYDEIAAVLLAHWPWGEQVSVNEWVRQFGSRWSDQEVEAAVWKLVAEAAARGHLLVDLTEVKLSGSTPLALLNPDLPPILPDPLPEALDHGVLLQEQQSKVPSDPLRESQGIIPGPTFDASTLTSAEQRSSFHRNLAAVTPRLEGVPRREVARTYGMHPFALARLEHRVQHYGQLACVPHATYHRDRQLHPAFEALLRKLYTHPIHPTIMAVYEDVRLQQLAEQLSKQAQRQIKTPSYKQVRTFLKSLESEPEVRTARTGLKHPSPERLSPSSFVLSIPYPAQICQVDEHTLDLFVTSRTGVVITRRVHAAVLICVKTAAILGAVLALDALREEDYLRLVKQALEPKDRLILHAECQHAWPCSGKPTVIFHDRGKIFTSERTTEVLVERLGITTEQAPPYAPSANELIAYCSPCA